MAQGGPAFLIVGHLNNHAEIRRLIEKTSSGWYLKYFLESFKMLFAKFNSV